MNTPNLPAVAPFTSLVPQSIPSTERDLVLSPAASQSTPVGASVPASDPPPEPPSSPAPVAGAEPEATLASTTLANASSYRTVEAIYADLSQLAAENPTLAKWVDIGDSYEKTSAGGAPGYDLFALQLSSPTPSPAEVAAEADPELEVTAEPTDDISQIETLTAERPSKPVLFIQAAIHGEDIATSELATRFAESLIAGYGVDPEATALLDYFEIRMVPIVNPDGQKRAEAGNPGRKNANPTPPTGQAAAPFPHNGVDLDRNYDMQWGQVVNGASTDPASPVYQGSAPFSEPETQALRDYLLATFPTSFSNSGVFIDLQSNGNQIRYPNRWTQEATPDDPGLRNLGLKLGYFTAPDGAAYDVLQASDAGIASGTASDWVYQTFGVATYTIAAGSQTAAPASFEATVAPELLPALTYATKAAQSPYQAPLGPDVQSIRLGSAQAIAGYTSSVSLSVTVDSNRRADAPSSPQPGAPPAGQVIPPPQIVAGARYSIDAPSWVPGTPTFDMSIAAGAYDSPIETMVATIDVSSLQSGRHTIFVEGLDATGNYGIASTIFLDVLNAPTGASILRGTDAIDTFTPTQPLNFVVLGRGGNDQIQTTAGQDLVLAGDGNDTVMTGAQDDVLYGGAGEDGLNGGDGDDQLYGEAGADQLWAGAGNDLLWGGGGNDRLIGEAGSDTFALSHQDVSHQEGKVMILDFKLGEDRIGLVGTLKLSQLTISQTNQSTLIQYGQTPLAELVNTTASSLTAASFTSLAPIPA